MNADGQQTKLARRQEIEELIADSSSPVGIDAKKTHVLILEKLAQLEERLGRIEEHLAGSADDG